MNEPLISVCIITYNSSNTILETLDSIKNQTYPAVELVVSDDCSRDTTTELVEKWISENKARFSSARLIKAEQNHGTAVNLDIAIRNAKGEWIKILAGDDLLTENCLSSFYEATQRNPGSFYISDIEPFSSEGSVPSRLLGIYAWFFHCASFSISKKIKTNLFKLNLPGPAYFFSRNHYLNLYKSGPLYSMLDEWPLILKTLLSGNDIIPVNKKLVLYRVQSSSLSHQNNALGSKRIFDENKRLFLELIRPELQKRKMFFTIHNQELYYKVRSKQFEVFEQKGKINTFIYRLYQLLPISVTNKLKQVFWIIYNYKKGPYTKN